MKRLSSIIGKYLVIILIVFALFALWWPAQAQAFTFSFSEASFTSDTIVKGYVIDQTFENDLAYTTIHVEEALKGFPPFFLTVVSGRLLDHDASFFVGEEVLVFLQHYQDDPNLYRVRHGIFGVLRLYGVEDIALLETVREYVSLQYIPPNESNQMLATLTLNNLSSQVGVIQDAAIYDFDRIPNLENYISYSDLEYMASLVANMRNENYLKRGMIVAAGRIPTGFLDNALFSALHQPHSRSVREAVAAVWSYWGAPGIDNQLQNSLTQEAEPEIRESVAYILGEIKAKKAVPVLMQQLEKEPNESVRAHILMALGKIEDNRAMGVLKKAAHSKNPRERKAALQAITRMDNQEAFGFLKKFEANSSSKKEKWFIKKLLRMPKGDPEPF